MNFKLYQINLTRDEINNFNESRPEPRVSARRDLMVPSLTGKDIVSEKAAKYMAEGMYDHVADIVNASNLEDAFFLGQERREPGERLAHIKMQAESMSSISVGDILVDENDYAFVVATFGFNMLPEKITA